jgi:hypothetical protein
MIKCETGGRHVIRTRKNSTRGGRNYGLALGCWAYDLAIFVEVGVERGGMEERREGGRDGKSYDYEGGEVER